MVETHRQIIWSLEERVQELEEEVRGLTSTLDQLLERLGESVGMMRPPPESGQDVQRRMVVALGIDTEHWRLVEHRFPGIRNCCIDVARAFRRESDEDPSGSGFDADTRTRIMTKGTWRVVWEVVVCVCSGNSVLVDGI